jgi:hypothetical protein
MSQAGLFADVRTLFASPTLAEFAAQIDEFTPEVEVPPNLLLSALAEEEMNAEMNTDIEEFHL